MGIGQFFQEYWWLLGGLAGTAIFARMIYRRYRAGRLIPTAMASLVDNRRFVVPLVVIGIAGMSYVMALDVFDDPRMVDGELPWEDLRWWEMVLSLASAGSILVVWGAALQHAWKRGKKTLAVLMAFVWPIALVYAVLPHNKT